MPSMTLYIPFGDDEAEIVGTFVPARKGCNYLRNGDPGYPPEPADFYIDRFIVNGNDIMQEVMQMYKKVDNDTFGEYIDYITPLLIEQAQLQLYEDDYPQYEDECWQEFYDSNFN